MATFDSREFEFADIRVSVFGAQLTGLRGLTYKTSQEKEPVYGAGPEPKAIQRGNRKYEGTLMLLKSDYDQLEVAAKAAGFRDLIAVPGSRINITVTYSQDGFSGVKTDKLIGVDFTELEDGMKQGDKFKEISMPFQCLRIIKA